ncbi:MAG TPA: hypothetical protein VFI45_20835 [Candidatus Acidoferrum sp.]|nr:hypothetical protein [Candidatus Acidoferrum sp.]
MKFKILCGFAVFTFVAAMTPAQTKLASSGKCGKPASQQSIAAGDQIGHLFTLASGKCATKGEVGGAASKEGVFSEHGEVTEDHSKASGVYIETFEGGDKIFYTYQATGTMRDSAFQAGENKYQITGGTGKMKGIEGSGSCKTTGTADGGMEYTCTGQYKIAGVAAAK